MLCRDRPELPQAGSIPAKIVSPAHISNSSCSGEQSPPAHRLMTGSRQAAPTFSHQLRPHDSLFCFFLKYPLKVKSNYLNGKGDGREIKLILHYFDGCEVMRYITKIHLPKIHFTAAAAILLLWVNKWQFFHKSHKIEKNEMAQILFINLKLWAITFLQLYSSLGYKRNWIFNYVILSY